MKLFAITFLLTTLAFARTNNYAGKKVLHIDSYSHEYTWSKTLANGIDDTLKDTGIEVKHFEMDTKHFKTDEDKQKSGLKAKELIETFKPDVVIVSDDNAVEYVLKKYYKNSKIPFVFCGVNWDATKYGLPYANTTGMLEVEFIRELYNTLRKYAKGPRIGFLGGDTETDRYTAKFYQDQFFHENLTKMYFAKDYGDFKKLFIQAQSEVDILYFNNGGSIKGWSVPETVKLVREHTRIPLGTNGLTEAPYALVAYGKFGEEQGQWSAQSALKILDGTQPLKIPIVKNKRMRLILNRELADRLHVIFNPTILKWADVITVEEALKGDFGLKRNYKGPWF